MAGEGRTFRTKVSKSILFIVVLNWRMKKTREGSISKRFRDSMDEQRREDENSDASSPTPCQISLEKAVRRVEVYPPCISSESPKKKKKEVPVETTINTPNVLQPVHMISW